MSTILRIRNLERFQHYKHRTPPWIKLYQDLLDVYEFSRLPDHTRFHAIALLLLASRMDNELPDDSSWLQARIGAKTRVDIDALLGAKWLERVDLQGTLAECVQGASQLQADCARDARESRGEESRGETYTQSASKLLAPSLLRKEFAEEFWPRYPRKVSMDDAEKAYAKARRRGATKEAILAGLERAQQNWVGRELDKIPYAASWLNKGGHKDQVGRGGSGRMSNEELRRQIGGKG